ncbi:hypothetical protein GN958_ATG15563, partial [Phytophthora infestans]
ALVPGNSQRARLTALNAVERFAASENMTMETLYKLIGDDSTGKVLFLVLDKFGVFLAFKERSKGSLLSKNAVASYFGNNFTQLLGLWQVVCLQKIASVLDKYGLKRSTEFTHQAPPCTKKDLRLLTSAILSEATHDDDYKDAALMNLLWYLLGRSSDTMSLLKSQIAVYPGGWIYINFKRMKSASCQGASLFHERANFASCPIHTVAVAT